jgi:hypothetical protein
VLDLSDEESEYENGSDDELAMPEGSNSLTLLFVVVPFVFAACRLIRFLIAAATATTSTTMLLLPLACHHHNGLSCRFRLCYSSLLALLPLPSLICDPTDHGRASCVADGETLVGSWLVVSINKVQDAM